MAKVVKPLNELTATEIARRIAGGEITSQAVVSACLERIVEREPHLRAWAALDIPQALAHARARDAHTGPRGPLHGVPFGVKDIIETADLPTGFGSPIWTGNRTTIDSPSAALPKAAGAIILGKTVTSEFASLNTVETRNPHDPARFPGVSSSGSAVAVADHMVPVAIGTQTGGSILRPASYCGCIGFKPTYGTINAASVKPAIPSIDTIGLLARSIEDCELFTAVMTEQKPHIGETLSSSPTIGFSRTHLWDKTEKDTRSALEDAAARLAKAGARVKDVTLPVEYAGLHAARLTLNNVDRALAYTHERHVGWDRISPANQQAISAGLETPRSAYAAAMQHMELCRNRLGEIFDGIDLLLVPCTSGEAIPLTDPLADPGFQEIWTMMHTPAISLPTHKGSSGLPVGIQLVAPRWQDDKLLAGARWVLDKLGTA